MAVIRHIASAANYLTSRVEVDGQQISLSNPEKLLYEIWRQLEIPQHRTTTPLLDLYIKAIQTKLPPPHVAPAGIDRVHDNYLVIREMKRADLLDEYGVQLNAIISCNNEFRASELQREIARRVRVSWDFKIRPAVARLVTDRPWDFLESLIGHAAVAQQAGYQGLVVTIDEFEVEHNVNYQMWERVEQLVVVLRNYFLGLLDHRPFPLAVFFASVPQDANKGDAIIDDMVESTEGAMYELKPFRKSERRQLAQRIHDVYRTAYEISDSFDSQLAASVERSLEDTGYDESGQIRAFIKKYIAELDLQYGPPNVRIGM